MPTKDSGNAVSSFLGRPFAISKRLCIANMKARFTILFVTRGILKCDPWPVIRGEDNQGVLGESGHFDGVAHSSTLLQLIIINLIFWVIVSWFELGANRWQYIVLCKILFGFIFFILPSPDTPSLALVFLQKCHESFDRPRVLAGQILCFSIPVTDPFLAQVIHHDVEDVGFLVSRCVLSPPGTRLGCSSLPVPAS